MSVTITILGGGKTALCSGSLRSLAHTERINQAEFIERVVANLLVYAFTDSVDCGDPL